MVLIRLPLRPSAFCTVSRIPRSCLLSSMRHASTESSSTTSSSSPSTSPASADTERDIDSTDFTTYTPPTEEIIKSYDPVSRAAARKKQLPRSRYQFRSPRYYRGPLHPHQPLHPSHPSARNYIPGPFSLPRLSQTYDSILSHDLMVLYYQHTPFGTPRPGIKQRLREWDDSSPYHKNRPLRAPRGMPRLDLMDRPINFRNVPQLQAITVSVLLEEGATDSRPTHTAGMIVQALTTQRATVHLASVSQTKGHHIRFTTRIGKPIAVGTTMTGEQMWHFLSTLVSLVLPRIKEWKGVRAKSGDQNGNYTIALDSDVVELWPEVAVNYDAYNPKMIPSITVTLTTTATNDQDGRKLLAAFGIPFYASGQ